MKETQEQRSRTMRAVRSHDTSPEMVVRRLLRSMGFSGYRLHRKDLPGKPDVAFLGLKKAIFVHGCFWHQHECQRGARVPRTHKEYWLPKLERNKKRDTEQQDQLYQMGWDVLVVWECEVKEPDRLKARIKKFLSN